MNNTKKLTFTALLTALAMIIPIAFGFMRVVIGPFTATLTSHVPMFLAMLFGPSVAIMVGLGSALGFFMAAGPIVGARALMHVIVGVMGAVLINKGVSFKKVIAFTAPVHGILEALVVALFISGGMAPKYSGTMLYYILVVVGIGTILHHTADGLISGVLIKAMSKVSNYEFIKQAR